MNLSIKLRMVYKYQQKTTKEFRIKISKEIMSDEWCIAMGYFKMITSKTAQRKAYMSKISEDVGRRDVGGSERESERGCAKEGI